MERNELTTGEIVRNFRGAHIFGITQALENRIADRLEAQERTIATMRGDSFDAISVTNVLAYLDTVIGLIHCADGIKDLIVSMRGTAIELTARAEKAEAERDAADNGSYDLYKRFESISDEVRKESPSCKLCGNFPERCALCLKYNAFELRGLRGQPQEGEKA